MSPGDENQPHEVEADLTQGELIELLAAARLRIVNLEQALDTARVIGAALGILVERHKFTPDQAFEQLMHVSQLTHRKIRDLAAALVHTGVLPIPPASEACPEKPPCD